MVTLIASNASLATITTIQKTEAIPIFMMVSPTPALMKVQNDKGEAPANLFGVADNLGYIDTSFLLIPTVIKPKPGLIKVGMILTKHGNIALINK